MYLPLAQEPFNGLTFIVKTETDPASLAPAVREALWRVDPGQAIWANQPVTDLLTEWTSQRRFNTVLLTAFAAIALVLASIGVYGLMAFSVEQRVNEFGIRRALGGDASAIVSTVMRKGMTLALNGVVLGLVGALAVGRLIRGMLFGVEPFDPLTFVGVAALVVAVALTAAFLPAYRATRVDPMVALASRE